MTRRFELGSFPWFGRKESFPISEIVFASGYGIVAEQGGMRKLRSELENLGHQVLVMDHPKPGRKALLEKELEDVQKELVASSPQTQEYKDAIRSINVETYRKAKTLIELVENKAHGRVNAAGHSFGGLYLPIAALLRPDLFKKLVLINPAGWTGKENVLNKSAEKVKQSRIKSMLKVFGSEYKPAWDLAGRHMLETLRTGDISIWYRSLAYVIARLPKEFIDEAHSMMTTNALPITELLKQRGIDVSVVVDTKDGDFNHGEILEKVPDDYTKVVTEDKTHYGPVLNPKFYAKTLHELFTNTPEKGYQQAAE